jgi:hypothetical protein
MRIRMLGSVAAVASCLFLIAPAHADSLFGDFTIKNGAASASGGQVTFNLNGDGTIAASLSSLDGGIVGFGFDSIAFDLPESNFSFPPTNAFGWADMYGGQRSGFACYGSSGLDNCGTNVTWTIGNAGDFSSVSQALGGGNSTTDFFLYTADQGNQWGANAVAGAPVPEPETYAMMLAGLGLLGFVARRRKQEDAA